MKQETINRIKFLLDMATTGPWEMHVNAGYNGIMSGATPLFLADGALMADAGLVCMLVNCAPEMLDEIERLREENKQIKINAENDINHASAISDAYKHQKNVSALLKMDVHAATVALKDATEKLKELNIENAELKAEIELMKNPCEDKIKEAVRLLNDNEHAEAMKVLRVVRENAAHDPLNQALNEGDGSYRP